MTRIAWAAGAALGLAGVVGAAGPALAAPESGEVVNLTG